MGRLTEALDYINQPLKPAGRELWKYHRILPHELEPIRKEISKHKKEEQKTGTKSVFEFSWEGDE